MLRYLQCACLCFVIVRVQRFWRMHYNGAQDNMSVSSQMMARTTERENARCVQVDVDYRYKLYGECGEHVRSWCLLGLHSRKKWEVI